MKNLEEIGENLVGWFSNNQMKLNTNKCHYDEIVKNLMRLK